MKLLVRALQKSSQQFQNSHLSTNLCNPFPGYCDNNSDDDALLDLSESSRWNDFDKRGSAENYNVDLGNGVDIRIIGTAYPAIGHLFNVRNASIKPKIQRPDDSIADFDQHHTRLFNELHLTVDDEQRKGDLSA